MTTVNFKVPIEESDEIKTELENKFGDKIRISYKLEEGYIEFAAVILTITASSLDIIKQLREYFKKKERCEELPSK